MVTKATSRIQPDETGGGILADEMGMGKTLSILSLIAKTLEHAHSWAGSQSPSLSNGVGEKRRTSRATLVVVSSACRALRYAIASCPTQWLSFNLVLINGWLDEIET